MRLHIPPRYRTNEFFFGGVGGERKRKLKKYKINKIKIEYIKNFFLVWPRKKTAHLISRYFPFPNHPPASPNRNIFFKLVKGEVKRLFLIHNKNRNLSAKSVLF